MTAIERHLFDHGGWIPAAELARLHGYEERQLRSRDGRPGICSDFAISGNAGLKHLDNATSDEWSHFYSRLRRHSIAQLIHLRRLRDRRRRRPQLQLALTNS